MQNVKELCVAFLHDRYGRVENVAQGILTYMPGFSEEEGQVGGVTEFQLGEAARKDCCAPLECTQCGEPLAHDADG
jgi:hypothetical protein